MYVHCVYKYDTVVAGFITAIHDYGIVYIQFIGYVCSEMLVFPDVLVVKLECIQFLYCIIHIAQLKGQHPRSKLCDIYNRPLPWNCCPCRCFSPENRVQL